jgi:cobalt/nickel transport protein
MYRTVLTYTFVCLFAVSSFAHFPILKLDTPMAKIDQPVLVWFAVGHPYEQDYEDAEKPHKVIVVTPTSKTIEITNTLKKGIFEERKEKPAIWTTQYSPKQKGDFVFALDTKTIFGRRKQAYQDYLKTVLHVDRQNGWRQRSGQPLEIVPLTRPYGLEEGFVFTGQLLKGDEPVSGVEVLLEPFLEKVPDLDNLPAEPFITRSVVTDPNGVFSYTLPTAGWWIVAAYVENIGSVQHQDQTYTLNSQAILSVYIDKR